MFTLSSAAVKLTTMTEMTETNIKTKRAPNFSLNDCLLLAKIMGSESPEPKLSNHAYLRHKFTINITAASKKSLWKEIEKTFCTSSEFPRDNTELSKKWDNLVQKHRAVYADHQRSLLGTGGGPCTSTMSSITEAVIDVIGRTAVNVTGLELPSQLDSNWIQLESLSHNNEDAETSIGIRSTSPVNNSSRNISTSTSCICGKRSGLDDIDMEIKVLKKKKLELEIKVLERQLNNTSDFSFC